MNKITHAEAIKALLEGKAIRLTDKEGNQFQIQVTPLGEFLLLCHYPFPEIPEQPSENATKDEDGYWFVEQDCYDILDGFNSFFLNSNIATSVVDAFNIVNNNLCMYEVLQLVNAGKAVMFTQSYLDCPFVLLQLDDGKLTFYGSDNDEGPWERLEMTEYADVYDTAETIYSVSMVNIGNLGEGINDT